MTTSVSFSSALIILDLWEVTINFAFLNFSPTYVSILWHYPDYSNFIIVPILSVS